MTEPSVETDPETGVLALEPGTFDALVSHTRGEHRAGEMDDHLAALRAADVLDDPAVALALRPIAQGAPARVTIHRDGVGARAWVADNLVTLVVPVAADRVELTCVFSRFLPVALARLVGLEPRPRPPGEEIELDVPGMARYIAGDGSAAQDSALPTPRGYWRAQVEGPDGPGESCEVLDTDAGLYQLSPGSTTVRAVPADATEVWRRLVVLARESLGDPAAS